ncbi:MAG: hypothetical protein HRU11_02665 [Parvularculaceae bacterium]|nr:hypothetical protein [Parvularculaceae bacterium]
MFKPIFLGLACVAASLNVAAAGEPSLDKLKKRIVGRWTSISCELRPQKNPADDKLAPLPTYLKRDFTYDKTGGFAAVIEIFADDRCSVPMVTYNFSGQVDWHGPNPVAEGAFSQDYVLNKSLELVVHAPAMAAQLNQLPEGACGEGPFVVDQRRDILGKPCALLARPEGSDFVVDHDLLYIHPKMPHILFMGGKHVDGTGFYFPEDRPVVGLQQPLIRTKR